LKVIPTAGGIQCNVPILGWRVFFTTRRLPQPRSVLPLVGELGDLDRWLHERELLDGAPFVLGPGGSYDLVLNRYFTGTWLRSSPKNTQAAVAYDLKKWLDFLVSSRDRPTPSRAGRLDGRAVSGYGASRRRARRRAPGRGDY